jgi:Rod binding domain-containing protein
MQTHSIQFGQHKSHSRKMENAQAHARKVGGRFVMSHPKSSGDPDHDALVKQTQKWVSQTFYGEMLKEMRKSPFKDKVLSGGQGGEAFTQMFDQHMADKMAKGTGKKLVDAIVNKIESGKAHGAPGHHAKPPHHNKIKAPAMSPTLRAKMGGLYA